jgi:hypothetical protein
VACRPLPQAHDAPKNTNTMTTTREQSIPVGKYLVSPLTHSSDGGDYTASVSIRSGHGSGTHDRVFRFAARFSTREGARRYAIEQGVRWAQPSGE